MSELVPTLLAGGVGTRLWPRSRTLHPKQFQPLVGDRSPFQETLVRLRGLEHAPPVLVVSEAHRFLVAEQCEEVECRRRDLILEPVGRNTAPAVALAALRAIDTNEDPILLVLPSDHHIADEDGFRDAVRSAVAIVGEGLVTFGVVPTRPETGYGYIRRGRPLARAGSVAIVEAFVEKPDLARARTFAGDGRHLWNSGMFLFRATAFLRELERHRPDIHRACRIAYRDGSDEGEGFRPGEAFTECPSESIDYAVMEHTEKALVSALDVGWSDVGSWSALWEISSRDEQGNATKGDVLTMDVRNSLVHASHRLVAVAGVENAVVVETDDALLVTSRDAAQDVGEIVARLESSGRTEHESDNRDRRPWGSFESVERGPGFQVKRITVKPGGVLSLQMHDHRSEHWVVVGGTAEVTRGEETFTLETGGSTYIPRGTVHRLANPGEEPLELIEVQLGSYLGEDDIVRLEDRYGRAAQGAPLA